MSIEKLKDKLTVFAEKGEYYKVKCEKRPVIKHKTKRFRTHKIKEGEWAIWRVE
jgi:hypothetical protein